MSLKYPNIAIIGKMGAGKSTVANGLLNDPAVRYDHVAIAGKLKEIAVELFGPGADKSRYYLQGLGQYVRSLEEDAWIDIAIDQVIKWSPAVIDDVRYPNEYDKLKAECGAIIVRVEAPLEVRIERLKANGKWGGKEALEHESETALDHLPADYTIINDGTSTPNHIQNLIRNIAEANAE